MIAVLVSAVFGATVFVEQHLPGVEVGTARFPAAQATVNTDIADVNRDGRPDLVLPLVVRLQIAGRFPDSASVRHPENGAFERFHIENDLFFGYRDRRVVSYRFITNEWSLFWESAVPNPPDDGIAPIFEDIDGDGHAELIFPGASALRVYRLGRNVQEAGELAVYPPRRPAPEPAVDLWTLREGPPPASAVSRRFRLSVLGDTLRVYESLGSATGLVEHRFTQYEIGTDATHDFVLTADSHRTSFLQPGYVSPCFLNEDDVIDFAGVRVDASRNWELAAPVVDFVVSIGGGASQSVRVKSIPAFVSAADFDADGDVDIVVESTGFLSAPPREMMTAFASQRKIDHRFSVYVQEPGGRFAPSARDILDTRIRFDGPAATGDSRWNAYRTGGLTSAIGDVNGDGRCDIVVWDQPRRVSVYVNHEGEFDAKPNSVLNIGSGYERLAVADIDRDGRDDIVLVPSPGERAVTPVYFSR